MNNLIPTTAVTGLASKVIGPGLFVESAVTGTPNKCPGGGTYGGMAAVVPDVGTVWANCSLAADPDNHVPPTTDTTGW
ncbi:MAG: hypothetical protein QM755_24395 [Luteolibacter sp.]